MIRASSNSENLSASLERLRGIVRTDAEDVIRQQGRLLFSSVLKLTPPKTLAQGRAAVKRDIEQTVRPIKASKIRDASMRAWYERVKGDKNSEDWSKFVAAAYGKAAVVVPFSPELHQKNRDRRGRAKRTHYVTLQVSKEAKYIRERQQLVGSGKGGWVAAIKALGGSAPAWATRWAAKGNFRDNLRSNVSAYIEGKNFSEWASGGDEDRIIDIASGIRSRAIDKNIEDKIRRGLVRAFSE